MAAEQFICPRCKTTLNKPVQYQVLGDVSRAGGTTVLMGSGETLPCPVCGHAISKHDIISGKLDPKVGTGSIVTTVVVLAVIGFVLYQCMR